MTVDPKRALVVGVDFGTLSGRALVVRVSDGAELGSAVHEYAIMGTSTCYTMNSDQLQEVPGVCGVVDGGISEGLWGSGRRGGLSADHSQVSTPPFAAHLGPRATGSHVFPSERLSSQPSGRRPPVTDDRTSG
jgi:hypothetical protein